MANTIVTCKSIRLNWVVHNAYHLNKTCHKTNVPFECEGVLP